jgi:hypothetical protein
VGWCATLFSSFMAMAATFPASLISGSAATSMLPRTPLLLIHQVLLYSGKL